MGRLVGIALLIVALVACAGPALAQKRVALVIGNSAYQHAGVLANPRNDATDMVAAFKSLGFQVVEGYDLAKTAFDGKVLEFATALKGADAGVFFYAGHGLQVGGQNYLVPVDAKVEGEEALDFELVKVEVVHRNMERQTSTNILFLDACRNNPLARNLARAMGTRSVQIGQGLRSIEAGVGTLISFATAPDTYALDGIGRNSPYTAALIRYISTPGDDLNTILINVRKDVRRDTQGKQVPWEHSSLEGKFYFSPVGQTAALPKVEPARLSEAAEAWAVVKDATNVAVLETYIARYKDTFYAELARARIDELKKRQVAVAKTDPPPQAKRPEPPADLFDGEWEMTGTGDQNCIIKNWAKRLEIRNLQISGNSAVGRVDPSGRFEFTLPAPFNKNFLGVYRGKLEGDSGKGTFKYPVEKGCGGSIALKKL